MPSRQRKKARWLLRDSKPYYMVVFRRILLEVRLSCPTGERRHREYKDMSFRRISKREIASSVDIVMVGLWVPPPVLVRTSYGRGRALAR
ncbi:hypothetical protein AVEN_73154-1 [Araneus ventricosus]|uniref:Uncharacterized protein n=1 Tax=Araneus ventricosus TaxID=182803 RepID=A0A4Y2J1D2_ARAVE|nr:hypothetical protein AVEN_73154-1 [Araneus ventricosus]